MTDPTNDNDIDALQAQLMQAREDEGWFITGDQGKDFSRALTALVAERDKAKADFSDAWRERCEFARRIDAADEELAGAVRALQKAHDAMVLAQTSHNRVLTCDPPIDAWKYRCVDAHLGDAIRECAAAIRKGEANAE